MEQTTEQKIKKLITDFTYYLKDEHVYRYTEFKNEITIGYKLTGNFILYFNDFVKFRQHFKTIVFKLLNMVLQTDIGSNGKLQVYLDFVVKV